MNGFNPYQPPLVLATSKNDANNFSLFIFVTGFVCALAGSIGALGRCLIEMKAFDFSFQSVPADPSAMVALLALAFAIGLSMCLYCFLQTHVAKDRITYCQCLMLIAILAMSTRAILDPSTAWTPTWQTYALTSCGVIALVILLRDVRVAFTKVADSPGEPEEAVTFRCV